MPRIGIVFLAILLCIPGAQAFFQRTTPAIRQVDHILVESRDPKTLFLLFADTFQCPVAWPLSENTEYVTGGIGMGNLNLEFFLYPGRRIPETNFYGIAFEPYPLADALRRLRSLGIPYSPPEPTVSNLPNGTRGTAWITVGLQSLSKPRMSLFLYEYSKAFLNVDVRRKQLGNRLKLNNGGPLGLQSVSGIVIGTSHLREDTEIWGKLLGKPAPTGGWNAGGGVAIRLVGGSEDGIREITLKIESLERAKSFLKQNRLMGPAVSNGLYLNPSKVQGLKILLTDKR